MLQQKNIKLRALEKADISLFYNWENDTQNWTDSQTLNPYSKELLNKFIEDASLNVLETLQLRLVIELIDTEEVIGFVDLFAIDFKNSHCAIGILIGNANYRKKGYALQAVQCAVNYAFTILNLKMIYAEIIETNEISKKLFSRTGFVKTAVKQDWVQLNRKFLAVELYQKFNDSK